MTGKSCNNKGPPPVTAFNDARPDCVSWRYDLTHKRSTRVPPTYQRLEPGRSFPIPLIFAKTGSVRLIVEANVLSGTAMELTILDAQGREVWRAQSSTRMAGPYAVDLETPGVYELRVANPSSSRKSLAVLLDVTACGDPAVEFWLKRHVELGVMEVARELVRPRGIVEAIRELVRSHHIGRGVVKAIRDHGDIRVAPMGIAVYGIKKDGERYSTYKLVTNAVRGVVDVSPNILTLNCMDGDTCLRRIFTIQLNTVVAAELIDGGTEYYWAQNAIGFGKVEVLDELKNNIDINIIEGSKLNGFEIINNIHDITAVNSTLNESKVRGRGKVFSQYYKYIMPDPIPFDRVELETWVRVKNGEIIIEFYVNRRRYDKVVITPRVPATSAHIVAAPAAIPIGLPLDLELVLGGCNVLFPFVVLKRGRIRLELYVREKDKWIPPPSAWSIGSITYERSHAHVVPQGVGSALIVPGEPNLEQLWP